MKYYGEIGFAVSTEDKPGVWDDEIVERPYFGDVVKDYTRPEGNQIVDNIDISNQISIVADPYAYENFHHMKYIRYMGAEWNIKSVDVQRPRLVLSIGGVYNGRVVRNQTAETTPGAP